MGLFHVYTDGACSGNPGPGGWAAVILDQHSEVVEELSGFQPNTTNNRMEVSAAIFGLGRVLELDPKPEISLYSDSNYLIQAYTEGWMKNWLRTDWKKGTVKNQDLWQELNSLLQNVQVNWVKVKGHSDNVYNNRCDHLAVQAIKDNAPNAVVFEEIGKATFQDMQPTQMPTQLLPGQDLTADSVKIPAVDPLTLNNPAGKRPSDRRCLVSIEDMPTNFDKIKQVSERCTYDAIKQVLDAGTLASITSSVSIATYSHPQYKVHPFFLQVGEMADFWLESNARKSKPYPAPTRTNLIKFICSFIVNVAAAKASQIGL